MLLRSRIIIFTALFALCGAGALAQDVFVVDKVVANVGNSTILYSEMQEMSQRLQQQRREQGFTSDRNPMSEALEYLLMQRLLYNQALIDSVEINTEYIAEMVEEEVGQMVAARGSVAALEAYYHKPIFEIKKQVQENYSQRSYAHSMQAEVQDKVTITPGEVDRYYRSLPKDSLPIVPEQYVYAQITRYPSSTREAKQRVRERLLEMRERVINGTQFELLARMYSVDPSSAIRGGEIDPVPKETFVSSFANALDRLKPGQVSEVVETEYGFHLIQLVDVQGNLYHVRHILLRPQFTFEELADSDRLLDSLARQIRADSVSFEKAALEYSDDPYSKQNGGLVSNHDILEMYQAYDASLTTTKFFREDLQPDIYRVLSRMRPGDVSDSFQGVDLRNNVLSRIVKLVEVIPSHPANLKDDYLRIEEIALEHKQAQEFERWLEKKIAGMYIWIDPAFRYDDFDNPHWIK